MDGSTTTNTQTSRKRRRPSSSTRKTFKTILTTISIITFLSSTLNQSYYCCNCNSVYAQSTTGLRKPHHTNKEDILDILSKRGPQHGLHSPRPRPSQDYYHVSNKLTSNRRLINSPTTDRHRQLPSDDTTINHLSTTPNKVEQRRTAWGEKGRDTSISHKVENIKRKKLNKLQALQELRARNKKNKKKSNKPGRGGNKKPGKPGGRDKKKSKPGRGKKNNGGGGRSKKKSSRPNNNGRSKKRPSKKKPNKKKPGRSNKKPNKPKKPNNGGKNKPGSRPGSRPGKNNGGKNKPKPNQGQQGSGKEDKPDKLQATQQDSGKDKPGKPDKPNSKPDNKPDKPNNKPGKDEPSFIAVKPNNKPDDADSIKPQAKPQQSSYQVVKPSKDKPKPNSDSKPDANSIKPAKPQSNFLQIALAYFNITKQDYKLLNAKQKEGILAMTDGQINFDDQQQENDGYLSIDDNDSDNSDSGADGQFNFGNINSETTDIMEEQTTIMKSLKWNFVDDELTDYSTLLDSFEFTNTNLNWDYGNWNVIDSNIAYTKYDNGSKSLTSGINSQVYNAETNGQSIYSNITLTTNSNFEGGVITFKIKSATLSLPNEALFVEVDNVVTLAPDVISMGGSSIDRNEEWKEYSIPVGNGKHTVKWVHVYNPFQLSSLPSPTDEDGIGLYMDDIRYVPYTLQEHNNAWTNGMVEMKRGGYVIASDSGEEEESNNNNDEQHWKISNDGDTVKASSSSIQDSNSSSGHSYIQFELYSSNGGLLTYRIKSSTSAPHDDYAISINNINVESIFGNMLGYESHSLSIPRGKAVITLKHRVNPGRLSDDVLRSLESGSSSDGETLLKDLNFSW